MIAIDDKSVIIVVDDKSVINQYSDKYDNVWGDYV